MDRGRQGVKGLDRLSRMCALQDKQSLGYFKAIMCHMAVYGCSGGQSTSATLGKPLKYI